MRDSVADVRPLALGEWLRYIDRVHPLAIDLGLDRVAAVSRALGLRPSFPLITVGGTNGKGSTCAYLESILAAAGYRVGCYTSPHLLRFNERVRIDREQASDEALCRAFAQIESKRGHVALTYFEFGTLAAMLVFAQAKVDVAVLEVGLGGRLDAVNAFDADCAIVTSVDLDHVEYLGDTREKIAFEKAGIFRSGRPAICADADPPDSLLRHAGHVGARLIRIGREFGFAESDHDWSFQGPARDVVALPLPPLCGTYQLQNASAALAALDALHDSLPVSDSDIKCGLRDTTIAGRFQRLPGPPDLILDVAHNPHAARALAQNLARTHGEGRTIAVFAMLEDKDIAGVVAATKSQIDRWLVAGIEERRGASATTLRSIVFAQQVDRVLAFDSIVAALHGAREIASARDRIVVFGSFHTVAAAMRETGVVAS